MLQYVGFPSDIFAIHIAFTALSLLVWWQEWIQPRNWQLQRFYSKISEGRQLRRNELRSVHLAMHICSRHRITHARTHAHARTHTHTHTHTHTTILWPSWILSGTTRVSRHQKGKTRKIKTIWIYCSNRQWVAVATAEPCKSASWPRHIATAASHHSVFLQAGCPSCGTTNSIEALKASRHRLSIRESRQQTCMDLSVLQPHNSSNS